MTCVTAVLWSLTESVFATLLHVEIVCMMCIATGIASVVCWVLTRDYFKLFSVGAVPVALATGWFTASVAIVLAARALPPYYGFQSSQSFHVWEPWLASMLLGLLFLLLMFEGRVVFIRSQPDDFMGILLITNGSMMSVVSVPFFIIIYGFLYMTREEESGPEHDESGLNRAEEQPQVPEDDVPIPPASGEP
ncbi:unnamed protein product [Symbiodinium natans]|uniref:Uncharacterized protein n=1 Tax=Symbiodinium natans TaxID=878477 RepID=A0A812NE90_9DINO|nr:unnamed protein product [Symbiodinium natans]